MTDISHHEGYLRPSGVGLRWWLNRNRWQIGQLGCAAIILYVFSCHTAMKRCGMFTTLHRSSRGSQSRCAVVQTSGQFGKTQPVGLVCASGVIEFPSSLCMLAIVPAYRWSVMSDAERKCIHDQSNDPKSGKYLGYGLRLTTKMEQVLCLIQLRTFTTTHAGNRKWFIERQENKHGFCR